MAKVVSISDLDLSKTYSYADYLTWTLDEAVELIRGKIFRMSPAPSPNHQRISRKLLVRLEYFFGNHTCEVFHAPFDVRLPLPPSRIKDEQIDTVVQPDICIICDRHKIDHRGCLGAPDWIIEILSPGTAKKDIRDKFDVYEFAGVKEYWIVYPVDRQVIIYTLNEQGAYVGRQPYEEHNIIHSISFPHLSIDLAEVFSGLSKVEEEWTGYIPS